MKFTSACLLLEVGNVSLHQSDDLKSTYLLYRRTVTVATLTVMALGAAVVPMCKSVITLGRMIGSADL